MAHGSWSLSAKLTPDIANCLVTWSTILSLAREAVNLSGQAMSNSSMLFRTSSGPCVISRISQWTMALGCWQPLQALSYLYLASIIQKTRIQYTIPQVSVFEPNQACVLGPHLWAMLCHWPLNTSCADTHLTAETVLHNLILNNSETNNNDDNNKTKQCPHLGRSTPRY
jgi:hypothetical protein